MARVVAEDARGVRSKDAKAVQFKWTDLKLVHEFADDSPYKGHAVAYIDHPDDLAALGKTMGHCAGTHFIWACEEKIWYFFTVVTLSNMRPHVTLHAKETKWMGKNHPRDHAEFPYDNRGALCTDCKGLGGINRKTSKPYCLGYADIDVCKTCNGKGYTSKPDSVPYPKVKDGGYYPTFRDVCAAFESVGKKYEAGKYAPLEYKSRTYEIPKGYKENIPNFDGRFARQVIQTKPDGVDDATWNDYRKAIQAMKAQFDKSSGAVQIVGRTFKFDAKNLVVLSLSGKGDYYAPDGVSKYRGMIHEFFVKCNSKKKEADGN